MTTDANGNVYVADSQNNTVRKVTPAGVVTTYAGRPFSPGSADGTGFNAQFNAPVSVTTDRRDGTIYVGDSGTLRRVTPAGVVTSPFQNFGGAPQFFAPSGLVAAADGTIYYTDNSTLKTVTPDVALPAWPEHPYPLPLRRLPLRKH